MSALGEQRLRTILKGVTDANGATGEVVRYDRYAPATINDHRADARIGSRARTRGWQGSRQASSAFDGVRGFLVLCQRRAGFYFRLGQVPPGTTSSDHHTPMFTADDGAIPVGVKAMSYLLYDYLSRHAKR